MKTIDIGKIVVRLGGRCKICGRKTDTVAVSDVEICASCLYNIARREIDAKEEKRIQTIIKAIYNIFNIPKSGILGNIIRSRQIAKVASILLFKR